jgi:hypothetical protein
MVLIPCATHGVYCKKIRSSYSIGLLLCHSVNHVCSVSTSIFDKIKHDTVEHRAFIVHHVSIDILKVNIRRINHNPYYISDKIIPAYL